MQQTARPTHTLHSQKLTHCNNARTSESTQSTHKHLQNVPKKVPVLGTENGPSLCAILIAGPKMGATFWTRKRGHQLEQIYYKTLKISSVLVRSLAPHRVQTKKLPGTRLALSSTPSLPPTRHPPKRHADASIPYDNEHCKCFTTSTNDPQEHRPAEGHVPICTLIGLQVALQHKRNTNRPGSEFAYPDQGPLFVPKTRPEKESQNQTQSTHAASKDVTCKRTWQASKATQSQRCAAKAIDFATLAPEVSFAHVIFSFVQQTQRRPTSSEEKLFLHSLSFGARNKSSKNECAFLFAQLPQKGKNLE